MVAQLCNIPALEKRHHLREWGEEGGYWDSVRLALSRFGVVLRNSATQIASGQVLWGVCGGVILSEVLVSGIWLKQMGVAGVSVYALACVEGYYLAKKPTRWDFVFRCVALTSAWQCVGQSALSWVLIDTAYDNSCQALFITRTMRRC